MDLIEFVKKIEPLIAIAVVVTLIILAVLLYQDNELKKEIAESCGYDLGEDYSCYCDKEFIINKKIELENYLNDKLDR
jgi:hypothetical protein